jgi:hypothetical protein
MIGLELLLGVLAGAAIGASIVAVERALMRTLTRPRPQPSAPMASNTCPHPPRRRLADQPDIGPSQ